MSETLVKVDSLRVSGLNPARRTIIGENDDLLASMREHGFLPMYPILLSKDGRVGDGHRRMACAKILGIESVPVVHTSFTVEELMGFNAGSKPFTGGQWTSVLVMGVQPTRTIAQFRDRLIEIAGKDAIYYLAERGISPRVVVVLTRLINYIGESTTTQDNFNMLVWLIENNQQRMVIDSMRDNVSPSLLKAAITEDRPLRRGNWQI